MASISLWPFAFQNCPGSPSVALCELLEISVILNTRTHEHPVQTSYNFSYSLRAKSQKVHFSIICSFKTNSQQMSTVSYMDCTDINTLYARRTIPIQPFGFMFQPLFPSAHNYLPPVLFQVQSKWNTNVMFLADFWNSSLLSTGISSDTTSSDKPVMSRTLQCSCAFSQW